MDVIFFQSFVVVYVAYIKLIFNFQQSDIKLTAKEYWKLVSFMEQVF